MFKYYLQLLRVITIVVPYSVLSYVIYNMYALYIALHYYWERKEVHQVSDVNIERDLNKYKDSFNKLEMKYNAIESKLKSIENSTPSIESRIEYNNLLKKHEEIRQELQRIYAKIDYERNVGIFEKQREYAFDVYENSIKIFEMDIAIIGAVIAVILHLAFFYALKPHNWRGMDYIKVSYFIGLEVLLCGLYSAFMAFTL